MLSPWVIATVLVAATLHATWNALVKTGGDRLLVLAAVNGVGTVVAVAWLPFVPVPAPASWPYLVGSLVLHVGYYFFLLQAYRVGDLSHVYPLARGAAPLLVMLGALAFAGEHLPAAGVAGVLLASAGIISLAFDGGAPWRQNPRPLLFALGTGLFIAAYTVVDGLGVRAAGSASGYIAWLFFIDGWPLFLFALWRRGPLLPVFFRNHWRACAGGGLAAITSYGLVIAALEQAPMAAVSALRESSVLIAVLIGTRLLNERFGGRRMLAATLVAIGVAVMNLR